jgi:hypothetical protein
VAQKGSEHGDELTPEGFVGNNAGGVLGGISTGQDITVSIAIKPTSSIRTPRRSIDKDGNPVMVETFGRHDPCVGIRATPIAEAMLALVLIDHALMHRAQCGDVRVHPRSAVIPAGTIGEQCMAKQSFNFSLFLFTYYAFMGTFTTYASLYFAARGMSVPQIGVLMSLVQVMRIVGPNLWGWVADHTSRRVLVLRMTALGALASPSAACFSALASPISSPRWCCLNLFTSAHAAVGGADAVDMRGDLTHYGRIRLWGSIGFIAAVMAAGWVLERLGVAALLWIVPA